MDAPDLPVEFAQYVAHQETVGLVGGETLDQPAIGDIVIFGVFKENQGDMGDGEIGAVLDHVAGQRAGLPGELAGAAVSLALKRLEGHRIGADALRGGAVGRCGQEGLGPFQDNRDIPARECLAQIDQQQQDIAILRRAIGQRALHDIAEIGQGDLRGIVELVQGGGGRTGQQGQSARDMFQLHGERSLAVFEIDQPAGDEFAALMALAGGFTGLEGADRQGGEHAGQGP